MRFKMLLTGVVTAAVAACSSGIKVRTTVEPNANLAELHTFHVLAAPSRRADAPALSANDPMLDNSITNRELRAELADGFEARGYVAESGANADFIVAYYAGTKEKFDTTYWGPAFDPAWRYTYWGRRYWAWPWYGAGPIPEYAQVQEHTEGELVVDVIDSHTNQLVWRGQGVAAASDNPMKYGQELGRAVNAILKRFPQAPGSSATTAGG